MVKVCSRYDGLETAYSEGCHGVQFSSAVELGERRGGVDVIDLTLDDVGEVPFAVGVLEGADFGRLLWDGMRVIDGQRW